LGRSSPVITRTTAVSKSAGSSIRPTLAQHVTSMSVQPGLTPPSRLLIVDDVVTSGTTLMACALVLSKAYPGIPISAFALARVQSTGNPVHVLDPIVERVTVDGTRCRRS
jgi:predicted amidophosphoribosyltransferase